MHSPDFRRPPKRLLQNMDGVRLIQDGENVVLDERAEKSSFINIKAAGTVKVGKLFFPMAPLIGAPYGSLFQVSADGKSLVRSDSPIGEYITAVQDTERDNSSLFDRNKDNQKLGHEEIEALKNAGKSGAQIVEELCSNSATFEAKTEFSQDKYKRKKAKKYIMYITVRQPTARAICQAYYEKGPERVFNLRVDSLAVVLHLANIAAGTTALVFDNCMGVMTAAVLERMAGVGSVCSAHVDKPYCLDAIRSMNLEDGHRNIMCTTTLAALKAAKGRAQDPGPPAPAAAAANGSSAKVDEGAPGPSDPAAAPAEGTAGPVGDAKPDDGQAMSVDAEQKANAGGSGRQEVKDARSQHQQRQALNRALTSQKVQQLVEQGFASCIIAAPKLDSSWIMQQVLPLLQPSATFVVFSPWVQPLAECMQQLQSSKQAVMLQLHESWHRPHQVLPMRTHPQMSCHGTGGFVLSGIKVLQDQGGQQPALGGGRKGNGFAQGRGAKRSRE